MHKSVKFASRRKLQLNLIGQSETHVFNLLLNPHLTKSYISFSNIRPIKTFNKWDFTLTIFSQITNLEYRLRQFLPSSAQRPFDQAELALF